jgi:hypothetical protein
MNGRILRIGLTCAGLLAAGCARKTPQAAADTGIVGRLPPGAILYAEADVKRMLRAAGAAATLLRGALPAACYDLSGEVERIGFALYGTDPPEGAVVAVGASAEALERCLAGALNLTVDPPDDGARAVRDENRTIGLWFESGSAHLLVSEGLADEIRTALAGGESLGGSPVLTQLSAVEPGTLVASILLTDLLDEEERSAIGEKLGTGPDGCPSGGAVSIRAGAATAVTAVVFLPTAAAAEATRRALVDRIAEFRREAARAIQDPSLPMIAHQVPELLDSIRLVADGPRVRISLSGLPSGIESLGMMSAVAIPAFLRYVEKAREAEAELVLAQIRQQILLYEVEFGTGPRTERLGGSCSEPDCNAECVPRRFDRLAGGRYLPVPEEWRCSDVEPGCSADTAWALIGFEHARPLQYQFCLEGIQETGGGWQVTPIAFGPPDRPGGDPVVIRPDPEP